MSEKQVKLFGTHDCPECVACALLLVHNGIKHEYHDIGTPDGQAKLAEVGWSDQLPLLIIDGERYQGREWRAALAAAHHVGDGDEMKEAGNA